MYRYIFILLLGMSACNTGSTSVENKAATPPADSFQVLRSELMIIHDATMARMDTLILLQKSLKDQLAGAHSPEKDSILANLGRLKKSDDEMMDWMSQYSDPNEKLPQTARLMYMKTEQAKIQRIQGEIEQSIRMASQQISQHN